MRRSPRILFSAGRRPTRSPVPSPFRVSSNPVRSRSINETHRPTSIADALAPDGPTSETTVPHLPVASTPYLQLPFWEDVSPGTRDDSPWAEGHPSEGNPDQWMDHVERILRPGTTYTDLSPQRLRKVELKRLLKARSLFQSAWASDRFDILFHIGCIQGRWETVHELVDLLIVKKEHRPWVQLAQTNIFSGHTKDLVSLTTEPIHPPEGWTPTLNLPSFQEVHTPHRKKNLKYETSGRHNLVGGIWRSLGFMVHHAANQKEPDVIMHHVLRIIGTLHHYDDIPAAVYTYPHNPDNMALRKSPLIPTLSTRILTALSDAALRARQDGLDPEHAPGFAFARVWRTTMPSAKLSLEIWMEFVLSVCLHGGWLREGSDIIERLVKSADWRTFDWRQHAEATDAESGSRPTQTHLPDELRKTVSWEVVAGIACGLVDFLPHAIVTKTFSADLTLSRLEQCKALLKRTNMGLGTMSWDAMLVRLLTSEAVDYRQSPKFAVRAAYRLSSRFGEDIQASNTPSVSRGATEADMVAFEPSSVGLGVMQRAIQSHIDFGNAYDAVYVFSQLLRLTDENVVLSAQSFFRRLQQQSGRSRSEESTDFTFDGNTPPLAYPNYRPKLSIDVLGRLLDVTVAYGNLNFGRYLIYSEDVDGPIIRKEDYSNPHLTPALVRYAVRAQDQPLLERVLGVYRAREDQLLTFADLYALRGDWSRLTDILAEFSDDGRSLLPVKLLAIVAREVLIESARNTAAEPAMGTYLLLLEMFSGSPEQQAAVLPIKLLLGTVDCGFFPGQWQTTTRFTRGLAPPSIEHLNLVLEGACESGGSDAGLRLLHAWCTRFPNAVDTPAQFPGPLTEAPDQYVEPVTEQENPPLRVTYYDKAGMVSPASWKPWRRDDLAARSVRDVVIPQGDGTSFRLRGVHRLAPNAASVRILFRSALRELLALPRFRRAAPEERIAAVHDAMFRSREAVPKAPSAETRVRRTLALCAEEFTAMKHASKGVALRTEVDAALAALFPNTHVAGRDPGTIGFERVELPGDGEVEQNVSGGDPPTLFREAVGPPRDPSKEPSPRETGPAEGKRTGKKRRWSPWKRLNHQRKQENRR